MAEITATRRGELVRKVLEMLLGYPKGLPAKEVLERAEKSLTPTENYFITRVDTDAMHAP